MTEFALLKNGEDMKFLRLNSDEDEIVDHKSSALPNRITMSQKETYCVVTESAVSLSKNYILHLTVSRKDKLTTAIGLSNNECMIYILTDSALSKLCSIPGHDESISELNFDKSNSNLLYSSSTDGTLKLWDLRDPQRAANTFKGQESLKTPLLSFDVDSTGRVLCAGTEHTDGDAFLLFWDSRNSKLLGGYWESHDDDITQVSFHKTKKDLMVTGSTDGLINVFDVSQPNESDALQYTYNTMSSVQKLSWFSTKTVNEALSCITHTNDLQLWDVHDCSKIADYRRSCILDCSHRTSCDDCYLIDTHSTDSKELIVLTGSNAGNSECLEALSYHEGSLSSKFSFPSNKQIIRCSWYDKETKMFIMGGESGILSVWKPSSGENDSIEVKSDHKMLSKKSHKVKPY